MIASDLPKTATSSNLQYFRILKSWAELATAAAAANGLTNPQRPQTGVEKMPPDSPRAESASSSGGGVSNPPETSPPPDRSSPSQNQPQQQQLAKSNKERPRSDTSPTTAHATSTTSQSQSRPNSADATSAPGSASTNNIRQLAKVKRFLSTLQQFGNDISPEIGESVHQLIFAVACGSLAIEDFHSRIQEVTNYPLRPFVMPFLKANLPLMQSDLFTVARNAKQSPQHYLRSHETFLLDPHCQAGEPFEIFHPEAKENALKRSRSESRQQHKDESFGQAPKRSRQQQQQQLSSTNGVQMPLRFDNNGQHEIMRERIDRIDRYIQPEASSRFEAVEDAVKNILSMLNCIIGMVEKTKRAVSVLQRNPLLNSGGLLSEYVWSPLTSSIDSRDSEIEKKRLGEAFYPQLNYTRGAELESRVAEVRRRAELAEEAVNEVKRHAVLELQKALSAAESRTSELLAAERAKMNSILSEASSRRHLHDAHDHLHPIIGLDDSETSCWNCGRRASETCSGCNLARYCGSFCQHKDWETHHKVCSSGLRGISSGNAGGGLLMTAPQIPNVPTKREAPTQEKAPSPDTEERKDLKE